MMRLLTIDYEILAVLDEDGGCTTGHVTRSVGGSTANTRKSSALMYRNLYSLSTAGFVKEMDDKKPICWVRTPAGTEALERYKARIA